MPIENAIELFNCSLCSYCETSLDGLASHIRKHIKPEPEGETKETSNRTNHLHGNNVENAHAHDKEITLMNGDDSSIVTSHNVASSVALHDPNLTNDANPLSPRIEVINPRTVSVNSPHNIIPNDSQKSQPIVSTFKSNFISPLQEKIPQISYARNLAPQQSIRQPNIHPDSRLDHLTPVPPPPPRYVQLHPREPQYIEINSGHHGFPSQYVANISGKPTLVHTDLIPVVSTKNGLPELGPRGEVLYRTLPVSERIGSLPKNIAPAPPLSSPNRITNNDVRVRSTHSYDVASQNNVHHSYQARPVIALDNNYRSNLSSHPIIPHTLKSQRASHSAAVSPLASPFNTPLLSPQNHKPSSDERLKQYHMNRLSGLQLSDIQKQHSSLQSIMGVPNNGTIFLNPEQLMLSSGNSSIDQLAGVLVIPLKKTSDVACQTDTVSIGQNNATDNNTRGIQTDLLMGQVRESHSQTSTPVFGAFRTTDELFECLVCGEEFASDHHLQEHMSKFHTHVCEKCYHSTTNINEHNMHITDCGNRDTEMICMECNSTFVSLKKLNQHRSKIHNVRMPFRCGVCNVPFETHEAVMKHISTHDMEVPEFKCRYCVKVFQSAEGLNKHFIRHKGVDVLHECRFCKKMYSTSNLLNDHVSYVHVIRDQQDNNEPVFAIGSPAKPDKNTEEEVLSASKKYPLCRHCDLAFKNSELLQQHVENCSKNNDAKATPFVCDVCKEYYSTDLQRKQHLKKEHKRDSGFRCPKCSKIYRTWSRLKFHTKQQHLKKTCPDCPMIFTKEHVLRKHQEDKHGKPQGQPGDRVYTCSLCHTMLNTLTELMTHRKEVHPELSEMRTADRSSNATMLSYIDSTNDDATGSTSKNVDEAGHLKTYPVRGIVIKRSPSSEEIMQNPDSFKCETCGLFFEDEKRLKNHKGLIHGEKPFKCNLCSKSFQYSSQVVWHLRTHKVKDKSTKVSSKLWKSKNKKFAPGNKVTKSPKSKLAHLCQFCGAKFSQEKLLKNHKGSVHKIKLFSCDICSFQCGHSTELIWHIRTCRAKFKRKFPDSEYPTKQSKSAKLDGEASSNEGDGYVCHVCDNAFNIFENYQSHMKTHPGEEIPSRNDSNDDAKDSLDNTNNYQHELGEQNFASPSSTPPQNSATRLRSPSSSMANLGAELLNIEPEFDQSVGEYVCPVCHKTTRSMTGMKTHYGRVHGVWSEGTSHKNVTKPKPVEDLIWPCKNCDRQFSSLGSLRHHSSVIHGFSVNKEDVDVIKGVEMELNLPPPSTIFTPSTASTATGDACYSCPYCDASFTKSKSIRVHAFKKHGTILPDSVVNQWRNDGTGEMPKPSTNPECIRFKCMKCKSKFRTTKSIRHHSLKRHNVVLTKKEVQKSKIRVKLSQDELLQPLSPPGNDREASDQVFPCEYCGRVFANHRAYFTHYRQAHRDATEQLMSPKKPSKNEIVNYTPMVPREIGEDGLPSPSKKTGKLPLKKEGVIVDKVDCPKCDQTFTQIKGLYTHLYAAHQITKEKYPSLFPDGMPILPNKQAACPVCDRVCVDNRAMRIHIFKAHGILYKDITKDFQMEAGCETEKDEMNGDEEIPEEIYNDNDNELRVVEAELGPPVCFICGRLFKSRRALMTHEYKYHGIRWVGNKRVFPQQVRNVPNLKRHRSSERTIAKMNKMDGNEDIDDFQNDSMMYSGCNSLDDNQLESEFDSDYREESISPVPEIVCNELCPKCPSRFHNRRALTTHLVRIHKYKKAKLHKYFAKLAKMKDDESNDNDDDIEENDNGNVENDVENNDDNTDVVGNINITLDETEDKTLDNPETYLTGDGNLFCLNGNNLLDMDGDVENDDVNLIGMNDNNEGDCDTIQKSDIEVYEDIGKVDLDMNGDLENSENIDVDDIDNLLGASIFTGKYDMNVNGNPFDDISTKI